jgi:hypothetical protein
MIAPTAPMIAPEIMNRMTLDRAVSMPACFATVSSLPMISMAKPSRERLISQPVT